MSNNLKSLSNRSFFIWYVFVLIAIFIFLYLIAKDIKFPLFVTILGFIGSIVSLLFSKVFAKHVHDIQVVTADTGGDGAKLYHLVEELVKKANLPQVPEVGIYDSPDCNAFATGFNKAHSLVAFSTGLLNTLSYEEIEAVAAHEIGHIANLDMLGTVLIEGAVKSLFYFAKIPFLLFGWFIAYGSKDGENDLNAKLSFWTGTILSTIVMFFGQIIGLFFSRHREYKADAVSALLTSPDAMVSALNKIAQDENEIPIEQAEFACFKINNKLSFMELFSTHPTIEKRIAALKNEK